MKKLTLILLIVISFIEIKAQDTIYIYPENSFIRIDDLESVSTFLTPGQINLEIERNSFVLKDGITKIEYDIGTYEEIFQKDTVGFSSQEEVISYLGKILNRPTVDAALQDQTTQAIIQKFNRIAQSTTLAADVALNDTFITVLDTLGAWDNRHVIIFNPIARRFTSFDVLSIGIDTLYLDGPLDFAYDSASFVDLTSTNLAVDGSQANQTFGLRGVSPSPIGITVDITRIIVTCLTANPVDLSKFGDIVGGITNGLVLRVRDGEYFNIFNVKNNSEFAGLGYDWNARLSTNPAQGQDGFIFRLTFASQGKIGVAIRLEPGEDIEFIVQDDLSDITLLEVMSEGHIVENTFNILILLLLFARIKFNE